MKKATFGDIYSKRLNEIFKNADQKSANAGAARNVMGIIPYVVIVSFCEYLWKSLVKPSGK